MKKYSIQEVGQLSLREKVGQLFNVRVESLVPGVEGSVTEGSDAMTDFFRQYPCGGVTLFGANITGPEQIAAFTVQPLKRFFLYCGGMYRRLILPPLE